MVESRGRRHGADERQVRTLPKVTKPTPAHTNQTQSFQFCSTLSFLSFILPKRLKGKLKETCVNHILTVKLLLGQQSFDPLYLLLSV